MSVAKPRVLVLSRNYPNTALPTLGIWVDRMVKASRAIADPTVVAPVPWVPPGVSGRTLGRYRGVPRSRLSDGIAVHHPRIPVPPGYAFHSLEATLAFPFIERTVNRLHRLARFDLIHAHFIYPDGVIAARLGERLGIPVMTTEHAFWLPWLTDHPYVRRQVERALPYIKLVTTVSDRLRQQVREIAPQTPSALLPNAVDDGTFVPPQPHERYDPDQLLFVGVVRHVKGLDLLVRALALLTERRPRLHLLVVGDPYYRAYRRDEQRVRQLIVELGMGNHVRFAGQSTPAQTAAAMRSSALLVLASRRESFGVVVLEALASGTPVVATRCGGAEETLTADVAHFAPVDDAPALARTIELALAARPKQNTRALHEYAVSRFGFAATAARLAELYGRVQSRAAVSTQKIPA